MCLAAGSEYTVTRPPEGQGRGPSNAGGRPGHDGHTHVVLAHQSTLQVVRGMSSKVLLSNRY
ncbi:hypothetical protein BVI1335_790003 [Burkholderia vietnamiensis]|nr:hypothetical protein BVI1335_790003 [Burkholderia vietnamiensis]